MSWAPNWGSGRNGQGHPTKTSMATRSMSCDHPDEDAIMTNPPRPSEDPVDTMGDDKCRPDAPTEPSDMPEGMKVEEVETGGPRGSKGVEEDPV